MVDAPNRRTAGAQAAALDDTLRRELEAALTRGAAARRLSPDLARRYHAATWRGRSRGTRTWLVVVAAEMVVNNSDIGGLGFMIIDAGNQGARYDLVVAGMVMIGVIGLLLDLVVRQLEKFDEIRWGYAQR